MRTGNRWSLGVVVLLGSAFVPLFGKGEENKLLLTLSRCEELALANNPNVNDARLKLELSAARQLQASHARFLPKFEVRNIWGPSPKADGVFNEFGVLSSPDTSTGFDDLRFFTEVELNLIQPIFTFGKLSSLNRAASYGVQAEQANLEKQNADAKLQIRELYWGLLLGKDLLAVVADAKKEMEKAEDQLEEKLDEGAEDVSQTDLFKLQLFKYEIGKRHREVLARIDLARSALRTAAGLGPAEAFELTETELEPIPVQIMSYEDYLDLAIRHRPERAQLQAGLGARSSLIQVSKSDYYPHFFLGGQVKYNYAKDRFDPRNPFVNNPTNFFRPGFVLGATLNLNFIQTRDKVRRAEIEYRQLAEKEEVLDDGIKLEVKKVYLDLRQSETNLRESRKALKASDNWLRSVSMTFDIGVGETKELIDAYKANSEMQSENLQNIFKFNLNAAKLSKAIGRDVFHN